MAKSKRFGLPDAPANSIDDVKASDKPGEQTTAAGESAAVVSPLKPRRGGPLFREGASNVSLERKKPGVLGIPKNVEASKDSVWIQARTTTARGFWRGGHVWTKTEVVRPVSRAQADAVLADPRMAAVELPGKPAGYDDGESSEGP